MAVREVDRTRQHSLIVSSVVLTSLAALAVALRVVSRSIVMRKLGVDDWMMLVSLFFTGSYLFQIIYGLRFGIGLHISDLSPTDVVSQLKLVLSIQLTYPVIVSAIKISILCFYLRLAANNDRLWRITYGTIIFIAVFFLQTEIVTALQCRPISMMWDPSGQAQGHCIDSEAYFYFVAVINVLLDIWVLILPIKTLKNINRPTRDKIALFIIFGLGALACIANMIRLHTIRFVSFSSDQFYDGTPVNNWSMIEINVAIICASVPALRPLCSKIVREHILGSQYYPASGRHSHPIESMNNYPENDIGRIRDLETDPSSHKSSGSDNIGTLDQIQISSPIPGIDSSKELKV